MKNRILILIYCLMTQSFLFGQEINVDNGYEKGLIKDGYKEGVWEYFDHKVLKLKVDYTNKEIVYMAEDSSKYAIKTDNGWEYSKLDTYPRYIGSMDEIYKIFGKNLVYPVDAMRRGVSGTVFLSFEINHNGGTCNATIINDIGEGCGMEVLKAFYLIPNYWISAVKDGYSYQSRFILPVNFELIKSTQSAVMFKKRKTDVQDKNDLKVGLEPANFLEVVEVKGGFVKGERVKLSTRRGRSSSRR